MAPRINNNLTLLHLSKSRLFSFCFSLPRSSYRCLCEGLTVSVELSEEHRNCDLLTKKFNVNNDISSSRFKSNDMRSVTWKFQITTLMQRKLVNNTVGLRLNELLQG